MKNILVIAYYFPPSGGPGVQRVLNHIKYLPQYGWNPIVLTVSNGQFPARDESLLDTLPKDLTISRTKIYEPYDLYRMFTGKKKNQAIDVNTIKKDGEKLGIKEQIAEFIRATFFIPDARIGWLLSARKEALRLIKEYDIKAIYSSSPPYTCSLIAKYAKKQTGLPWVAGFRDPWTGFISSPNRWFIPAEIDKYMEKNVFMTAEAVECAWVGIIKDAIAKYPRLNQSKFHYVPNGYNSEDFPDVTYTPNTKFTITYTGSMYGRRNPQSFLSAINLLIKSEKVSQDKLHLRFVGRFGDEVMQMFADSGLSECIEIIGYVPHKQSIAYLMQSEASLLIIDESKESHEIVPGKVFEYIGVLRPVLAVGPTDGAVAGILLETRAGTIAHQTEIENIANNFYF